jgi:ATP-dependent RNA helicase DDX60
MEKTLRESDDGVLVYVAPTKALVSQIAAEIYARFSKDVKSGTFAEDSYIQSFPNYLLIIPCLPIGTCWAIHTRDYRVNDAQKCQILVTVPEMLSIMMLSPPLARTWLHRIKRLESR